MLEGETQESMRPIELSPIHELVQQSFIDNGYEIFTPNFYSECLK